MQVLFFVLDDPELLTPVLRTFYDCGVKGATVLNSTGMGRVLATETSIFPDLRSLFQGERHYNYTIYALIDNDELIDKLASELEKVVGSFDSDRTGMMFVMPVLKTYGVQKFKHS